MVYADGRAVSSPGGQTYTAGHSPGYPAQAAGHPQYFQQQQQSICPSAQFHHAQSHTSQHPTSASQNSRYQLTPAQALQQQASRPSSACIRSIPAPPLALRGTLPLRQMREDVLTRARPQASLRVSALSAARQPSVPLLPEGIQ